MLPLPDCPINGQSGLGQARDKFLLCFSYMFDDRKTEGNPGRIIDSGAAEDDQQHFPVEAPKFLSS